MDWESVGPLLPAPWHVHASAKQNVLQPKWRQTLLQSFALRHSSFGTLSAARATLCRALMGAVSEQDARSAQLEQRMAVAGSNAAVDNLFVPLLCGFVEVNSLVSFMQFKNGSLDEKPITVPDSQWDKLPGLFPFIFLYFHLFLLTLPATDQVSIRALGLSRCLPSSKL